MDLGYTRSDSKALRTSAQEIELNLPSHPFFIEKVRIQYSAHELICSAHA